MSKDKRCSNREARVEVIVGLFVALILLALGVFTIVVSGASLFRNSNFKIQVVMPDAMGLRRNDPVIAKGTTVGTVSDVYFAREGVHVVADLVAPVQFHEDYSITVVATSILGGRQLVLNEGDATLPVVTDVLKLRGQRPSDIMEDATAAMQKIRSFLETDTLSNLQAVSDDLSDISGRLNRGEGMLGRLLSSDEAMYTDLSATVANLRAMTDRLEAGEGLLGRLLSSDEEVYADLSATVANLRVVTDRLVTGEGTLGKLLAPDSRMYDNIDGAVTDVREMLDDAREANTLSTFTSILFGGF